MKHFNHRLTSVEFQQAVDAVWDNDMCIVSFARASGFSKKILYNPRRQTWTLEVKRDGEVQRRSFQFSLNVLSAYNETVP